MKCRSTTSRASHSAAAHRIHAVMTELVIALALLRIGQDGIGFVDLLHLLLAFLDLVGVKIRVILTRHLAVGFLDIVLAGTLLDAQYLVVISFIRHIHPPRQDAALLSFMYLSGRIRTDNPPAA